MKNYSVIRNYKKFKKTYLYFVIFIKCGSFYYTFDSDAKIMMYVFDTYRVDTSFRIEKYKWSNVVNTLLDNGVNVVLAGWKNAREYYTNKENIYAKVRAKSKESYKNRIGKIIEDRERLVWEV